jgi:hypothetical protein
MAEYIFIDESGDPGKPFKIDSGGVKVPTGASLYYILGAVCLDTIKLMQLECRMMEVKNNFGYKKEIKSNEVSLGLYKALLDLINELDIKVYFRLIDKTKYKGKFAIDGRPDLGNVFDEYNLAKLIQFTTHKLNLIEAEIVIDRADRRLHNGNFIPFNCYIKSKANTKTIKRVGVVAHVNSEYVNVMQMSDLIGGALRDNFTGKNKDLLKIIKKSNLYKVI